MAKSRIVVDGSNIATEGRSLPSLAQLEGALVELRKEFPKAEVTVVVDATFAHRIDESERKRFEEAVAKGEYITPPAGAIGRGDAFILLIAEKAQAVVLSNDSFQEFHGDHSWLFDSDRLLGASPVPGVGWIFIPRTPVRGAKSRAAVRGVRSLPPLPKPKMPPPARAKKVATAPAVDEENAPVRERRPRHVATSVAAVNDPTTFITFIASHPLGAEIEAEVESFTSHGAIIRYQGVQCYAPLSGLGSPPPRSPREVLARGEVRTFVIRGLDPERRGIELALPGVADSLSIASRSSGSEREDISLYDEPQSVREPRRRPRKRQAEASAPGNVDEATAVEQQGSRKRTRAAKTGDGAASRVVASTKSAKQPRETSAEQPSTAKPVASSRSAAKSPMKARPQKRATTATKSTGTKSTGTKSTGTKSTGTKSTGTKSTGTKSTGTKSTGTKSTGAKSAGAKSTATKSTGTKSTGPKSADMRSTMSTDSKASRSAVARSKSSASKSGAGSTANQPEAPATSPRRSASRAIATKQRSAERSASGIRKA